MAVQCCKGLICCVPMVRLLVAPLVGRAQCTSASGRQQGCSCELNKLFPPYYSPLFAPLDCEWKLSHLAPPARARVQLSRSSDPNQNPNLSSSLKRAKVD